MNQGRRLADFAYMVRESSLKRFRVVQPADRAWRPALGRLSFVDHLKHLVDCDAWYFAVIGGDPEPRAEIRPGDGIPDFWDSYIHKLVLFGTTKRKFLANLEDGAFDQVVEEPASLGRPDWGTLTLRYNIDHEIHHRGMVQILLKLKYDR